VKNHMKNTYRHPGQFRAFLAIAWYSLRAQTRNPATFFFGFIFPLVFISIFGLIGGGPQKVTIGVPNGSNQKQIIPTLKKLQFVTLKIEDKVVLQQQIKAGKLAGMVEEIVDKEDPKREMVVLTTSSANPVEGGTVISLLRGIVDQSNLRVSGVTQPPIALEVKEVSGREFRYIDFALPGQIGFALLSTALFGTVFGLIYLKKAGVLKRMFATPTKPLTILLAQGTSRLVVALAQTIIILGLGVLVFKFYLPHGILSFIEVIILSAVGLVAFLGFGYFIAGLANDENTASPLTNIVTLPQFLLSGTFFSTENFPKWIQPIANNLPLSYFNQAIRKVTTEGGSLQDTFPYMLGLLIWGAVMYLLAAKTFKWE
jgi:ABC-2 type transport system permease protein